MRIFIRITDEMNEATFLSIYMCLLFMRIQKTKTKRREQHKKKKKKYNYNTQ